MLTATTRPEDSNETAIMAQADAAATDIAETAEAQQERPVSYRYLDAESGKTIDAESVHWDEPELEPGAVVHTRAESGAKQPYTVRDLSEIENDTEIVVTVRLDKARNTLWKLALLGVLLTASWFALDWVINTLL